MAEFVEVASLDQVPPGSGTSFTVAGKGVAVFNVDGTIYAMDDTCLHQGSSLGAGKFDGKVVTCRAHGWRYDVTTGNITSSPGYGVASYPAKVVAGKILVAAPVNSIGWPHARARAVADSAAADFYFAIIRSATGRTCGVVR